ncbi:MULTISPECIES: hypothetical protein [unclassified Streptococcus]|uniref:hypothetical protein n=1 Tax=unclassified Streptococcus TaxID=2608887 RepID=UPI00359D40D9
MKKKVSFWKLTAVLLASFLVWGMKPTGSSKPDRGVDYETVKTTSSDKGIDVGRAN